LPPPPSEIDMLIPNEGLAVHWFFVTARTAIHPSIITSRNPEVMAHDSWPT
jgi:hypothetical protein